jgi:hypothetical protein
MSLSDFVDEFGDGDTKAVQVGGASGFLVPRKRFAETARVEWGWLNFYRGFESEPLLVDTNYLSDLFRREFTNAAARIFTLHEAPPVEVALGMEARAKKASG